MGFLSGFSKVGFVENYGPNDLIVIDSNINWEKQEADKYEHPRNSIHDSILVNGSFRICHSHRRHSRHRGKCKT